MKPNCADCKWKFRNPYTNITTCNHPEAKEFHRVMGDTHPILIAPWSKNFNDEHLAKCDRNGWFTKRKFLGLF